MPADERPDLRAEAQQDYPELREKPEKPVNRRKVTVTAPRDAWIRLGELLTDRRRDLGYTYRHPLFDKVSGVNQRLQRDIEAAAKDRIDHFTDGTLRKIARGYQVDFASMLAVLRGEADELIPAPPAAARPLAAPAAPAADPPGWPPERVASDRPFFDEINERRVELAFKGIAYPTGAEMFGEGTEDAKAWDTEGAPLPVGDRVWFIADLRRRASGRDAGSQADGRGA